MRQAPSFPRWTTTPAASGFHSCGRRAAASVPRSRGAVVLVCCCPSARSAGVHFWPFAQRDVDTLSFHASVPAGFRFASARIDAEGQSARSHDLHSFRRGWMLLACQLGVPLHECMLHGGWRTYEVALGYLESTAILSPLAKLWTSRDGLLKLLDLP
jgi:hypothetical protein